MIQMFGQMLWLPFSMFAGWMTVLATAMQAMQPPGRQTDWQGPDTANRYASAPGAEPPGVGTHRDNPLAQRRGATKEDRKMSDCCCCDDEGGTIKLVQYSIVSIKRCHEELLCQGEIIENTDMTPEAFATWVVALYLQNDLPQCPKKDLTKDDKKFLRVYSRVLESWPRQSKDCCGDNSQVLVLREIAEAIKHWGGPKPEPKPEPRPGRGTPAPATA